MNTAQEIDRLRRRIDDLEAEIKLFASGHLVMLDLLINTAISKGDDHQLEAALESLRGWYAHTSAAAFVNNEFDKLHGLRRGAEMVDVFLDRLRKTRDGIE